LCLQPAGSLSAHGPRHDIRVEPPAALELYSVRSPEPTERVNAVRASLRFLSLAPDRISFPLLAAVYRAPFGNVDFSSSSPVEPALSRRRWQRCARSILELQWTRAVCRPCPSHSDPMSWSSLTWKTCIG
jgi:hypothetical protein